MVRMKVTKSVRKWPASASKLVPRSLAEPEVIAYWAKTLIRSLNYVSISSSKVQFIFRKPITAVVNSLGLKLKNLFTIFLRRVLPLVIQLYYS